MILSKSIAFLSASPFVWLPCTFNLPHPPSSLWHLSSIYRLNCLWISCIWLGSKIRHELNISHDREWTDMTISVCFVSCCSFGTRTEFERRGEYYRMAACWEEHCNRRTGDRQLLLLLLPPSNNPSSATSSSPLIISNGKAVCGADAPWRGTAIEKLQKHRRANQALPSLFSLGTGSSTAQQYCRQQPHQLVALQLNPVSLPWRSFVAKWGKNDLLSIGFKYE